MHKCGIKVSAREEASLERVKNARNTITDEAIHGAFVRLICERKPELITVKRLAEIAGIHRKTFYLHYTCIEALYQAELSRIVDEYGQEVDKLPIPYDYYDLTKILFEFNTRDEYTELLYCDLKYMEFHNSIRLKKMARNRSRYNPYREYPQELQSIINAFVTQASNAAFRQWVADGKKVPMEDAVQIIGTLLEKGVETIRAKEQEAKDKMHD